MKEEMMKRTSYPELAKSVFRTVTGTGDKKDPLRRAQDALSTKVVQLGVSRGLKDWSNSSYSGLDAAAGIWAPVAKKMLAGQASKAVALPGQLKDEFSNAVKGTLPEMAVANPTGDTGALDRTGSKYLGRTGWNKARTWAADHAGEIGQAAENVLAKKVGPKLTNPTVS
jgi:hypothetical protein